MKILVDHERDPNLGNRAMLWGIVKLLQDSFKSSQIYVVETTTPDRVYLNERTHFVSPYYLNSGFSSPISGGRIHQHFGRAARNGALSKINFKPLLSSSWAWKLEPIIRKFHQWESAQIFHKAAKRGPESIQVEQSESKQKSSLAEYLSQFDTIIFTGGIMSDFFLPSFDRQNLIGQASAKFKKNCVFTGKQLGPFNNPRNLEVLRRTLNTVRVGLRDPVSSSELCVSNQLSNWIVTGDDSLGLSTQNNTLNFPTLSGETELKAKEYVVLNFRASFYSPQNLKCIKPMIAALKEIFSILSLPFVFVPIAGGSWDHDEEWGSYFKKQLSGIPFEILSFDKLTPSRVISVIGNAKLAVGVSYHFCTFALKEKVPSIHLFSGEHYELKTHTLEAVWGKEDLFSMNQKEFYLKKKELIRFIHEHLEHPISSEKTIFWRNLWMENTKNLIRGF